MRYKAKLPLYTFLTNSSLDLIYSTMPSLVSPVQRFDCASRIPAAVFDILRANAARANVILPHAEKVFGMQKFTGKFSNEQLWLVYSRPGTSIIQFVLSCTEGQIGTYPIFIVPTVPLRELTPELLELSMKAFCDALLKEPGFRKQRVYSIFSVDVVAKAFAGAWERLTEINRIEAPYYDATFTMCSKDTLVYTSPPPPDGLDLEMRPAMEKDAQDVALLCQEFAETSPPFSLSLEKASEEADLLIKNHQVWVLEITTNGESEIASIVAVTRKSSGIAAITKVYTPENWRRKFRCAERLVRRVCRELLKTHEQVVLYVGVGNPAAKVYDRVGFQGLTEGSPAVGGVEHWLEIGFDQAKVDLGHW
ncbi:N-acyltransferase superfamily [Rhizopogon vesiculosus]|uniref:N-acyltransferase superfamily n=1 Tax=Rhizopogon vesiculosus TaxID=180088 RepID=A0A1J8QFY2_9AGAM|nr:N-acyltransferase superfamily [Rhizopogon vesiculosus]